MQVIDSYVCDNCGKEYDDSDEMIGFLEITYDASPNSTFFMPYETYSAHICEFCVHKLLGKALEPEGK